MPNASNVAESRNAWRIGQPPSTILFGNDLCVSVLLLSGSNDDFARLSVSHLVPRSVGLVYYFSVTSVS